MKPMNAATASLPAPTATALPAPRPAIAEAWLVEQLYAEWLGMADWGCYGMFPRPAAPADPRAVRAAYFAAADAEVILRSLSDDTDPAAPWEFAAAVEADADYEAAVNEALAYARAAGGAAYETAVADYFARLEEELDPAADPGSF